MKIFPKIIFILSVAFFILSGIYFLNSHEQKQIEVFPLEPVIEAVHEPAETFVCGMVLAPNAGLNVYGRDGLMHKVSSVQKGDVLQFVQLDGLIDEKNIQEEMYVHVVYDDVDYWLFEDYVAVGYVPALMVEKADVYDGCDGQNQIIASLSFATIVAVRELNEENPFVAVKWYDRSQKKILDGYVQTEKISTYMDDVLVAAIVEQLRVTKRAVPRNELFKKAFALNPSPKMLKVLQGEQIETVTNSYQEAIRALPGRRYQVNVDELNTVDQSKDPFAR